MIFTICSESQAVISTYQPQIRLQSQALSVLPLLQREAVESLG